MASLTQFDIFNITIHQ